MKTEDTVLIKKTKEKRETQGKIKKEQKKKNSKKNRGGEGVWCRKIGAEEEGWNREKKALSNQSVIIYNVIKSFASMLPVMSCGEWLVKPLLSSPIWLTSVKLF